MALPMLNAVEQRVFGVLMEKSLTQPDAYPLTFNSIVLGANQKQNRDPVREFQEREVSEALRTLELKHLVSQAPPALGARSVRFQHHAVERFRWDRREQAVMAELLLRGRQTVGELRTHAGRMTPFQDLESIGVTLNALCSGEARCVEELAREPGRSANRFRHLLGGGQKDDSPAAGTESRPIAPATIGPESSLAERLTRLEARMARIEQRLGHESSASSIDDLSP
jgi:hypothetical protein